jgi:nucleotide-binding universal stress UspA family protein
MNTPDPNTSEADTAQRILVPLDGSDLAAKALSVAESIARRLSARLDLVVVVPPLVLPFVGGEPYIPGEVYVRLDSERTESAQKYLQTVAQAARDHGVPIRIWLEHGDPASRLLDVASELHSALIVMTTHGRTGLARFALGSVADRVVRAGAAPVLLLRSFTEPAQDNDLTRAIVPLDGSSLAEQPLWSVVPLLAGHVLREVTLLRVADPRDGEPGRQLCENYLNALRQRLMDRLGGGGCVVSVQAVSGRNPAATIIERAGGGAHDLVVMSTHGEAGVGRWAFGGVADRVLRDGKTPLLLVHPPRK